VTFSSDEPVAAIAERVRQAWFGARGFEHVVPIDEAQLEPYVAASQARDLRKFFEEAIAHGR
jgi:hypothetical protein